MKRIVCDEPERVGRFVSESMGVKGWSAPTAIGLEENGQLIAGVVFDYYNGASICMHVAAIGSRWMSRDYLWYCFHYPFNELKVRRITGLVPEVNMQARRFNEALGFELETRMCGAHPQGDVLVYRMTRDRCRFITPRYQPGYRHEQT